MSNKPTKPDPAMSALQNAPPMHLPDASVYTNPPINQELNHPPSSVLTDPEGMEFVERQKAIIAAQIEQEQKWLETTHRRDHSEVVLKDEANPLLVAIWEVLNFSLIREASYGLHHTNKVKFDGVVRMLREQIEASSPLSDEELEAVVNDDSDDEGDDDDDSSEE